MNQIIQDFLDSGHITKEAAVRLKGFDVQIKEAGILDTLQAYARHIAPAAITGLLGGFAAQRLGEREVVKQQAITLRQMNASFEKMVKEHEDLRKNRAQAQTRFLEVARFSPTFASTPSVAAKLAATLDLSSPKATLLIPSPEKAASFSATRTEDTPNWGCRLEWATFFRTAAIRSAPIKTKLRSKNLGNVFIATAFLL